MNTADWHFPDKAPKIGIQWLDSTEISSRVELRGDPFHFGAFEVGDAFAVCDYDLPDESLTQVSTGYTRGPVMFENRACTEIIAREFLPGGETIQWVRRLVVPGHRFGHILLITLRRPNGMGTVEVTDLEFPMTIEPRTRWRVQRRANPFRMTDSTHDTGEDPDDSNYERITGLMDVHVGKDHFRCLRWLRPRTTGIGYREAEEIFISVDTGLTVLVRGFVGSDYPDIERFQRSPKLEVAGEIFYLRYIRRVLRRDTAGQFADGPALPAAGKH